MMESPPPDWHRFRIGDLTVVVMGDLQSATTEAVTFENASGRHPNASEAEVRAAMETFGVWLGHWGRNMNPFLIDSGDRRILVDAGMGAPVNGTGHLLARLAAAGYAPEMIDTVVLTHAHGDHYRGLTTEGGDLVFPQATLVVWASEWAAWMAQADEAQADPERAAAVAARVTPVAAMARVEIDSAREIAPGVTLTPMPGHTVGHAGLLLESKGERLLAVVDLLHDMPQFAYPEWHMKFDSLPEQAVETRRAVLRRAADERLLVLAYHLPFPGLGYVSVDGDGFAWTAV